MAVKGRERKHDIFLRATREFLFEERLALPKGYGLKSAPEVKAVQSPSADFSASLSVENGALVLKERLAVKKKIVPAADYAGLRDAVEAVNGLSKALVVVGK